MVNTQNVEEDVCHFLGSIEAIIDLFEVANLKLFIKNSLAAFSQN
ncbi:MAG: hypothetical protein ACFFCC_16695 [Promethearchaeota archaeon]